MNKKILYVLIPVLILVALFFGTKGFGTINNTDTNQTETVVETETQTETQTVTETQNAYDYMILVNKQNKLPDDWEERVVLKEAKNKYGESKLVEEKALEQFYKLQKEVAEEEGVYMELDSTYRSVQEQQELWDDWTVEYGEDYVKTYVAPPGCSEHHTGLAIDVCLDIDGVRVDDNDDMIARKDLFEKAWTHLAKYGFILRYPEGKEDITGYGFEPWHFRYIDDAETAQKIMDQGITFEEYKAQ